MIENQTSRNRIINAALELAEKKPWAEINLNEIAHAAQLTVADLSQLFRSKTEILEGFSRAIDTEVLKSVSLDPELSVRDRLFDVLMTRFELLNPYKPALIKLFEHNERRIKSPNPLLRRLLGSQYWMLVAAGVDVDGPRGVIRAAGLASIYSRVFVTWLEDDDPGLAKTMATLDAKLRTGENWLKRVGFVRSGLKQLVQALQKSARRSGTKSTAGGRPSSDKSSGNQSQSNPEGQGA